MSSTQGPFPSGAQRSLRKKARHMTRLNQWVAGLAAGALVASPFAAPAFADPQPAPSHAAITATIDDGSAPYCFDPPANPVKGAMWAGSVNDTAATSKYVAKAADWLAQKWQEDPTNYRQAGGIADGIIALVGSDAHPDVVKEMTTALKEAGPKYVDKNPAGLAKVIMTAEILGEDPTYFLGKETGNLWIKLASYINDDSPGMQNRVTMYWGPHLITIALTRANRPVPTKILDKLLSTQGTQGDDAGAFGYTKRNHDGTKTFVGDPDYTGIALSDLTLLQRNPHLIPDGYHTKIDTAANNATTWAINTKTHDDGDYWETYSAANSTGMLASALAERGEDMTTVKQWLIRQQNLTKVGAWQAQRNDHEPNIMATDQAIMAITGHGYASTWSGKTPKNTPTCTTTPTTKPTVTPTGKPGDMGGAQKCIAVGHVWVYVEQRDGTSEGACASKFGNGLEALESAGFIVKAEGSMVTMINGYPTKTDTHEAYWSYWHATPAGADKSATWEHSRTGAASAQPKAGSIEGWYFKSSAADWNAGPSWDARLTPYDPSATPTPNPSVTPTQTPKPSVSPTVAPTVTPTGTPTMTPTGSATPTPSATETATATGSATATATATAPAPVTPAPVGPSNRPSDRPTALPRTGV